MWKFWAILGAALVAGAVYVVAQTGGGTRAKAVTEPVVEAPRSTAPVPIQPVTPPQPVETKPAVQPPLAEVKPAQEAPAAVATDSQQPAPSETTSEPAATTPKDDGGFDELVPSNPTPDITPTVTPPPVPEAAKPTEAEVAPENLKKLGDFVVIPGKVEKKDDGSLLLDGKYVLKGEGTPEKPYIVSWDLLTSAEEAFDPQNGKRRLPERVAMLDGKSVRLNGYIAFPMTSTEPRELLSMLNQWDGCCIGTPPTPYDAVEVALTETVEGDDRFATTGKVVGTFHVKPYLEGDWLIGLYVMQDAKLTPRDFGPGAN